MKVGAPIKYRPEYCEQVKKLVMLGAIDTDIAAFFNVSLQTLYSWKNNYPEFLDAQTSSKENYDRRITRSLAEKAQGYKCLESKVFNIGGELVIKDVIKQYPPDTTACIFWLKNRQPNEWRDVQERAITVNPGEERVVDDIELAKKIAYLLTQGVDQINEVQH